MSTNFDAIVKDAIRNAMKNRDSDISVIESLKKQITPHASKRDLDETFSKIINFDPDYIRKYLKASSNIVYQRDFYIDSEETKEKMLYRNCYNNDSVYLIFGNGDKILLVCSDSSLASDNYDFYADIFINGVKLNKKNYIEIPSTKHYNFKTGARRFLIDANMVDVKNIISVVIRKEPKCNSFFTTVTINDVNKKTYTIKKDSVGRYGEIFDNDDDNNVLENLLVFKMSALEDKKFFKLNTNVSIKDYIPFIDALNIKGEIGRGGSGADITNLPNEKVKKNDAYKVLVAGTYNGITCNAGDFLFALDSTGLNWGHIPFNYKKLLILDLNDEEVLTKDDVYLIINRNKHIECDVSTNTDLEDNEYIKYDANNHIVLSIIDKSTKVAGCYLPLPIKYTKQYNEEGKVINFCEDIEVYVDGYKLINNIDFIYINDDNCNQYIKFNGVIKPNSVITYRNKNITDTYNFYSRKNLDTFNSYVAFNDEFQYMIINEMIPNNTEVLLSDNIKCILYKPEYDSIDDCQAILNDSRFYRIVKDTTDVREILESNPHLGNYEDIPVDETTTCILCDEIFFVDNEDKFDFYNDDRYIDFNSSVIDLVEHKIINLEGIKIFDGAMFTKYTDEYKDVISELVFLNKSTVDTTFSYGIIDLDEYGMPICEDYIEAYLGRTRVPLCNKRSIINRYLKVDNQHSTLDNLEIYSEINWSDYAKYIINNFRYPKNMLSYPNEIRQNFYSQLKSIDVTNEITDSWLTNNEDRLNSNKDIGKLDDVFYGRFKKISISTTNTSDQKIKQNVYPIFRVLAYYNDEEYVDVTKYCDYIFKNENGEELPDFDTMNVGKQYVTAVFSQGSLEDLISDEIIMEVVAVEIESIKIINNTNIFTVTDNIFDCIRVIGYYENGTQRVVTDQCTLSLTNYEGSIIYEDGIPESEGSYVINAVYCDHISDTKTIRVSSVADRKIKKLDIIPNSILVNNEIVTMLDIYATYNNDQIQKVANETVDVYVFRDGELDIEPSSPDCVNGLDLDSEYTLRFYIYNDSTKTGDPIETVDGEFIEATIKLLSNDIKNLHQVIYYDNLTATLDDRFINNHKNDPDYYFYSIKNLDGIYMSIGQNRLTDIEGIMTIGALVKNEVVAIDFYNKDTQEFTKQLLFLVMDVNDSRISANGVLSGNLIDGYKIAIHKLALNEEYDRINFTDAVLKDIDGNVIVKYNTGLISENNNYTENGIDQYIYIYFKNFKTNNGNVNAINEYISRSIENGKMSLDLFFDIYNNNKIIELHVPADSYDKSEFEYFRHNELEISRVYIDDITYEDENWLVIEPSLPDEELLGIYEIRPEASYCTSISTDSTDLRFQLKSVSNFKTNLSTLRVGLNRYYYKTRTTDGIDNIYTIDIQIIKDYDDNTAVIKTINGLDIELSE